VSEAMQTSGRPTQRRGESTKTYSIQEKDF
jgi:hypothetical protein